MTAAALSLEATLEAGQNYTAIAMDDPEAEAGSRSSSPRRRWRRSPNAAMAQPTMSVAIIGLALVGLAFVAALPLAARRVRS